MYRSPRVHVAPVRDVRRCSAILPVFGRRGNRCHLTTREDDHLPDHLTFPPAFYRRDVLAIIMNHLSLA